MSSLKLNKKITHKIVEQKLEEAFSDSMRGDDQMGRFILLSVSICQQNPRLNSLYFFSFLKWPWRLDCIFRWK